jgi:hypothetical protein
MASFGALLLQHYVQKVLALYSQVVSSWHQIVTMSSDLNFGTAAEIITVTESLSQAFLRACEEVGLMCIICVSYSGIPACFVFGGKSL